MNGAQVFPAPHSRVIIRTMPKPFIAPELVHLAVPITDVSLWPRNPRRGDVGAISESLKRFGQVRPILVQKSTMRVVAGNHLLRAASALGWTEVAAVVTEMSDKQAKAYLATDNRAAELGDFDEEMLASLLADIAKNDTLEGTGYDLDDLEALLAKVGTTQSHGNGDPDKGKDAPEEPWVKVGQMFALGPHRIICGDASDPTLDRLTAGANIAMLVITPPATFSPVGIATYFGVTPEQFWFGAERYVERFSSPSKGGWLVWDKRSDAFDGAFGDAFELIWTKDAHSREILRHTLVGAADGEKHGGTDFAERPTALFMDLYERYSPFEAHICDPFSVGATALLAAEKTGRIYYGAKADPGHVQALLEKWKDFTGEDYVEI